MFNHDCFAEGSDVGNCVSAFSSFVIRSACLILVLTSAPQQDISVPSHFMTVTFKIVSLLLNALGTSLGILTFTASFNLEKAVDCHSCLFFLSGCCFLVFGVFVVFLFVWEQGGWFMYL